MANEIIYEERDQVAIITLNRPDRLNSISIALREQLVAALANLKTAEANLLSNGSAAA